jgi:glutaredoxin
VKPIKCLLFNLVCILCMVQAAIAGTPHTSAASSRQTVELTIFWDTGCPYCRNAKSFLESRPETKDWLKINAINVSASTEGLKKYQRANAVFGIGRPGVPLIIVGRRPFLGFDDNTGKAILDAARACLGKGCAKLAALLNEPGIVRSDDDTKKMNTIPQIITVPFVGPIPLASLSLPALTVALAAIDGFNPCAMWVLIFLVGLLLGMQDRLRMWLLGGTFLLTSGIVYFGFLAAWLNVFLFLGALFWVRLLVGLVALVSGGYYLYAFASNAAAECRVTNLAQRQRIMASLRASISEKRFLVSVAGIIVLAAAVNLIELLCSAGIPAVFTDVLAMSNLSTWQHYLYLLLYVGVFMLDDAIIFAIAMMTLHATHMTNRYLRISHLLGGVGMLAIGSLLLFAPQWLAFKVA